MIKTTYRRIGLMACTVLALSLSAQGFPAVSYAQSAGLLSPSSFSSNPQSLLTAPGGVGANSLNLLTGGGNSGAAIDPSQIAGVLGGAGMQMPQGQAQNILSSIQSGVGGGTMDPNSAMNLITGMATNAMPPQLTQALAGLQGLGQMTGDQAGITSLLNNPAIQGALQGMTGMQQGAALDQILGTALQGGAQGMSQSGAQALATQIQTQMPQLAEAMEALGPLGDVLAQALGGGGLGDILAGLTGGGSSSSSSSSSSGGGGGGRDKDDGNYELDSMDVTKKPGPEPCGTCAGVRAQIAKDYKENRQTTKDEFIKHRDWIVNTYWLEHVLPALMLMAEQLTVVGISQVEMIGAMLDAKHQLETQRLFQQLTAQAHKDYHPSEGMCTFGTTVRSLAASERKSDLTQVALADRMMQRQTLNGDVLSFEGPNSDIRSRLDIFISVYCDKADNSNGLGKLCLNVPKPERRNLDVDFTRNIESRLTLELDMLDDSDNQMAAALNERAAAEDEIMRIAAQKKIDELKKAQASSGTNSDDKQDLFALSANLYSHRISRKIAPQLLGNGEKVRLDGAERYLDLRSVFAKRSVAQNSFAALTAMRSSGDEGSAPYTKALIKELGISDQAEIEKILGKKPSYFAQMEVLTKKIYQNPTFYTELYDKPVNVERKGAAIQAISLMQDRDLYNSLLRSEAVLSVLLETMLIKEQSKVVNAMGKLNAGTE